MMPKGMAPTTSGKISRAPAKNSNFGEVGGDRPSDGLGEAGADGGEFDMDLRKASSKISMALAYLQPQGLTLSVFVGGQPIRLWAYLDVVSI